MEGNVRFFHCSSFLLQWMFLLPVSISAIPSGLKRSSLQHTKHMLKHRVLFWENAQQRCLLVSQNQSLLIPYLLPGPKNILDSLSFDWVLTKFKKQGCSPNKKFTPPPSWTPGSSYKWAYDSTYRGYDSLISPFIFLDQPAPTLVVGWFWADPHLRGLGR